MANNLLKIYTIHHMSLNHIMAIYSKFDLFFKFKNHPIKNLATQI